MCLDARRYAAAARFWSEAFAAEPALAADRKAGRRYNAACAAALAASGEGKDEPKPDHAARAKLRRLALDWLQAELATWTKVLDSAEPKARAGVAQTLAHWRADPDLSGIRDDKALAALAEPERLGWRALWDQVDRVRKQADAEP
jgi:hypothetical protein